MYATQYNANNFHYEDWSTDPRFDPETAAIINTPKCLKIVIALSQCYDGFDAKRRLEKRLRKKILPVFSSLISSLGKGYPFESIDSSLFNEFPMDDFNSPYLFGDNLFELIKSVPYVIRGHENPDEVPSLIRKIAFLLHWTPETLYQDFIAYLSSAKSINQSTLLPKTI